MITLFPDRGMSESASNLDNIRLSKQVLDVERIIQILADPKMPYQKRLAVEMWRGFERALCNYGASMAYEMSRRNISKEGTLKLAMFAKLQGGYRATGNPPFIGDLDFHNSHRSNLIRRDQKFYITKWADVPLMCPVLWPIYKRDKKTGEVLDYTLKISDEDKVKVKEGILRIPKEWT